MVERGQHFRFALEAREAAWVRRYGRGQDLDRDLALEIRVGGAIDLPHAAHADLGSDFVGAEARAGGQGHGAEVKGRRRVSAIS